MSFKVTKGSIYGFLRANGAGTTTIRILLGLSKADNGEIIIAGQQFDKSNYKLYKRIGGMIEEPSIYLYLTG